MEIEQARTLAKLLASKFIARPDVIAVQRPDGEYRPDREQKFTMDLLMQHLQGETTLGHYISTAESKVKLFVIDIDLLKSDGSRTECPLMPLPTGYNRDTGEFIEYEPTDLRAFWASRKPGPGRDILKQHMRSAVQRLASSIMTNLGINALAAYSGGKGVHVYGFTGLTTAERARKAALITMESCGWALSKGNNFFRNSTPAIGEPESPMAGFPYFEAEVFPKQDSVDDLGEHLGNLVRLPLGVNQKSPKDRPFFIDLREPLTSLVPMDPIEALTITDPFAYPHEIELAQRNAV